MYDVNTNKHTTSNVIKLAISMTFTALTHPVAVKLGFDIRSVSECRDVFDETSY